MDALDLDFRSFNETFYSGLTSRSESKRNWAPKTTTPSANPKKRIKRSENTSFMKFAVICGAVGAIYYLATR